MAEVLSQDEIDQLLTAINAGDSESRPANKYRSVDEFSAYLLARRPTENGPVYGAATHSFIADATVISYRNFPGGEELLADIERKNAEQNMGNRTIPGTNIKLINFSVCPKCAKVFSFKDLSSYYAKPKKDARFRDLRDQYRHDTRVYCHDCDTYFLPALVISDGTPRSETQFLCRVQTMSAIERFYKERYGENVLSRKKANILTKAASETTTAVRNDIYLKDMESRPTLITNLIQYTPAPLVVNLIDGTNHSKRDVLFGVWGGAPLPPLNG